MKKKILLILMLVLTVISLAGCGKDNGKNDATMLNTPSNVKVENNKITWDKVHGATSYEVKINDEVVDVPTNEYKIDKVLDYIDVATVIAKSDKKNVMPSDVSNPVVIRKELTTDEIKAKITDYDETSTDEELKAIAKEKALLLYKFKFELAESDTTEEVIKKHVDNKSIAEYFSYYMILGNTLIKQYYENIDMVESLPAANELYQNLFDDMKKKEVYESSQTKATEDKKFMNFILPMICNTLIVNGDNNEYMLLMNLLGMPDIKVDIIKVDNGFKVTDEYYGDIYTITVDEIDKIRKYDNLQQNKDIISSAYDLYINNAKYNHKEKVEKHILENEGLLLLTLQEKKEEINKTLTNLFNNYTKIQKAYTDLDNAIIEVENATTKEEKADGLEKIKVIISDSLKLTDELPKVEAVQTVLDLFLSSELINCVLSDSSLKLIVINQDKLDIMKDTILDFYRVIYDASILTSKELNSNLDIIFNFLNDPDNEEKYNKLATFLKNLNDKLLNKKYYEKFNHINLLNTLFALLDTQGADFSSIIGMATGIDISKVSNSEYVNEVQKFDYYMAKYDYTKLENIINNHRKDVTSTSIKLTIEERFEIVDLINYIIDYNKEIDLTKYETLITNLLSFLGGSGNLNASETFDLKKAYEVLKEYKKEIVEIFGMTFEFLLFENNDVNCTVEEHINDLKASIEVMKLRVNDKNYTRYAAADIEVQKLFNTDGLEITSFFTNYPENLKKMESLIGKPKDLVSQKDHNMLMDAPLNWYFPDPIVIEYDKATAEFVVKFSDKELVNVAKNINKSTTVYISINNQSVNVEAYEGKSTDELMRFKAIDIKNGIITNLGINSYEEYVKLDSIYTCYISPMYIGYEIDGVFNSKNPRPFMLDEMLEEIFNLK